MNSIKKHPQHFSLNLGKLLNNDSGQNPHIIYHKFSEITSDDLLIADTAVHQEFVIDCCNLDDSSILYNYLDRLYAALKEELIVRTILIKNNIHFKILSLFINNIRIIESADPAALAGFPNYKTRLSCGDLATLNKQNKEMYYIYRNPKKEEMSLPFEYIKTIKTDIYDISYYYENNFIYSVYNQL